MSSIMFVLIHTESFYHVKAFGSYDDAKEYMDVLVAEEGAGMYMISAVDEDEDLFHTINR